MIDSLSDSLLTTLMTLQLTYLENGLSPDSLVSSDSVTLAIMSQDRSTHAGELAYLWYTHAYDLPFLEYFPYDSSMTDTSSRYGNVLDSSKNNRNANGNRRVVSFYPNPATNAVTVSINDGTWGAGATITVSDMYGQKMLTVAAPSTGTSEVNINTQSWNTGIYIFTVQLGNGILYTSKVVIRRE
jgi:hypothetical protein